MRVYFDSCIAIYEVEQMEPWRSRIAAATDNADDLEVVVTDLVRMECLVGPLKARRPDVLANFERYFRRSHFVPLTTAVFDRAAELRANHNIRTPDAIHLAAALTHRCDEFWTNDNRLAGVSPDLRIRNFEAL